MVKRALASLVLGALGACTDEIIVAPVIDLPAATSDANPFPSLDQLELKLGIEGSDDVLFTALVGRGEPLELRGVPYSERLVLHMTGRIGNSEVAYGRTCPFAIRAGQAAPRPHLYFSRTVLWAESAMPNEPVRVGGATAMYHDGSGMFIGGTGENAAPLTAVERFNPSTGAFELVGQLTARKDAQVAVLGDGRVLIAGGLDAATSQPAPYLELIELDTPERRVERFPAASLALTGLALAALPDGRVFSFGGADPQGVRGRTIEISNDGAGISVRTLNASLTTPRRDHSAVRLSDADGAPVLITGGLDAANNPVAQAELFRPLQDSYAQPAQFAPAMVVPRRGHQTARLADDSVIVLGGIGANGLPVTTVELFSFDRGFVAAGELPPDAGVTGQSITTLADRRLLVTGGLGASGLPVDTSYIVRIDPVDGKVDLIGTDSLATPRAGHAATLLCDGTVLLVGGTAGASTSERYNPPPSGRRATGVTTAR
ncbi:MAG: hypothetical protein IPI49_02115 [Myxococcales bacterium]|nr:hypothetical protein [Myxococcales bacterium]